MKKTFISLAIILLAIVGISKSQKEIFSDITLENIEALAADESIYDYRQPKTERCKLDLGGGWFTSSVRRDCVFSAVPSSCTAVACGESF